MKLNIVMISRAGSQKNIWDVCSESVESLIHLPALRAAFQSAQAPLAHPLPQLSFWSDAYPVSLQPSGCQCYNLCG